MRPALAALTGAALARAAVPGPQQPLTGPVAGAAPGPGRSGAREPQQPTLYQRLQRLADASRFAKAVGEHPAVVRLLNSTGSRNYTLFVPTDAALEHHEHHEHHERHERHDGDPGSSAMERLLRYHVATGAVDARGLVLAHTLPTALDEDRLGGEPQRLRASVGLGGIRINFYGALVDSDMPAANGILHTVNHVLVPPLPVEPELELFPGRFSTLLLAYEKTGFVEYIHGVPLVGSTVFAPSNAAFARLGVRANAFLFNTEAGRRCLLALLKYQIAPNATLYSDAYYDGTGAPGAGAGAGPGSDSDSDPDPDPDPDSASAAASASGVRTLGREHYDLPTLLGDARIGVDIIRIGGLSSMRVNGFVGISIRDAVAKNGVIQVVDRVLLPPRKHGGAADAQHVDVEDLRARLEPYM